MVQGKGAIMAIMGDRSNVRQRRGAARILEFLAEPGCPQKKRKPVSFEEYESLVRLGVKDGRAKRRKRRRD
jgi:hypothetical protein